MRPHQVFAVVLALSTLNGIFGAEWLSVAIFFSPLWLPPWLPVADTPGLLFYAASLIVATTTLLLSGVPGAVAERMFPSLRGTPTPVWIWVATATLLSWPGIRRFLGLLIGS